MTLLNDVLSWYNDLQSRNTPKRLECGVGVTYYLKGLDDGKEHIAFTNEHAPPPKFVHPSMKIQVNPSLPPGGWRFLNKAGEVIREGDLDKRRAPSG